MDNSKYHDLDPSPGILLLKTISFSYKKVSLMVIVNIKVYKRIYSIRDHVTYVYIFILYVYMYTNVCMYVYVYVYMYMHVMYI